DDYMVVKIFVMRPNGAVEPLPPRPGAGAFDLGIAEAQLRAFAQASGVDVDELAERAGEHFSDSAFSPRRSRLTEDEIDLLVEDDRQAFDD
ncbi:MAG: hypothetical protein KY475_19970, partial [Planctomycetes bacterium]|nr:hypothetical protein [Planctomycetota bacterium]